MDTVKSGESVSGLGAGGGEKMRASVLVASGRLRVMEVLRPTPGRDEVLVEVAAVGVCGSDVHYFEHGRIGDFVVTEELILGHEASGVIADVGEDVPRDRIGERVAIEPQRACRTCRQCKLGRYNLCEKMEFYATPPIGGAFAEYVLIQSDYAFPIPDSMSLESAALCEPLSVGIWSNQKARVGPGTRMLVAGAGPIGVVVSQVARAFGAAEIVVSDPVPERRSFAAKHGATLVVDPTTEDVAALHLDVDAFIDASGNAAAVQSGIRSLAPAGTAVLVGMGSDDVSLPVATIMSRELVLTGVFRYANTWPLAIYLASTGQVDLDSLVTGRFGLEAVEAALKATHEPTTMKALVVPTQVEHVDTP